MAKNIFISNALPQEAVGLIPKDFTLDYNDTDSPLSKTELVSRLKGKDGLVCHIISTIDDEVLAAAPTLRVVANVAVGYNNIDVAAARRRGVTVTNTPDVLTETTADFAWTLLMATARRVVEADHYARGPPPHRRAHAPPDAEVGDRRQRGPRAHRGRGRAGAGPEGELDRGRGPRRVRGGTEDPPRPAPALERRARPAHRERLARH